ncbi:hypothetical protein EJ110_NYTH26343, partial [Nymphaea thermarum]
NGSNYRKAKLIIAERYSNIFTASCVAHCIDLTLEDIDNLENVASIMTKLDKLSNSYTISSKLRCNENLHEGKRVEKARQEENLRFMVASNDWRHVEEEMEKDDPREITYLIQNEDFWNLRKEIIMFV